MSEPGKSFTAVGKSLESAVGVRGVAVSARRKRCLWSSILVLMNAVQAISNWQAAECAVITA